MASFPRLSRRSVRNLEKCVQAVPTWLVALISILALSFLILLVQDKLTFLAPGAPFGFKRKVLIELIENAEAIAIMVAVILYVKGAPDRKDQKHYEAWRVIDTAANITTSYARYQALQDLHRDGVSLQWLEAPRANLAKISLPKANLIACNLEGANLENANLRGANLRGANLIGANLSQADLVGSDLTAANLQSANLRGAALWKATLWETNFADAEMRWAELHKEQLDGAKLHQTILPDGSLCSTTDVHSLEAAPSDAEAEPEN
ncbi:MAG: pentapeptide repeat-containing protein [Cyanobacteria bacterium P01_F01_bin.53]